MIFLMLMLGANPVDDALMKARIELAITRTRQEMSGINFRHVTYEQRNLDTTPYVPPAVPTYSQLRVQAVAERKPLIIFVNCDIPGVPVGYLVHRADKFTNPITALPITRPSIIVSAVVNKDLMCIKVLDYANDKPTWPSIYSVLTPYLKSMSFICPDGKCDPL